MPHGIAGSGFIPLPVALSLEEGKRIHEDVAAAFLGIPVNAGKKWIYF